MNKLKSLFAVAAASAVVVASNTATAAVTTIDTTEPLGQIAEGSTAAAVLGLAAIALAILIGVLIKIRRAGS